MDSMRKYLGLSSENNDPSNILVTLAELHGLRDEVVRLKQQLQNVDPTKKIADLEAKIIDNDQTKKIADLEAKVTAADRKVKVANECYDQIYEIVQELKTEYEELKPIFKDAKTLSKLNGQISTFNYELGQLKQKTGRLESDVQAQSKLLDKSSKASYSNDIKCRIGELRKEFDVKLDEVRQISNSQLPSLQKALQKCELELPNLRKALQKCELELHNLQKALQKCESGLSEVCQSSQEDSDSKMNKFETKLRFLQEQMGQKPRNAKSNDLSRRVQDLEQISNQLTKKTCISKAEIQSVHIMWYYYNTRHEHRKSILLEFLQTYTCQKEDAHVDCLGFKTALYQHFGKYSIFLECWEIDNLMSEIGYNFETLEDGQVIYRGFQFSTFSHQE